MLQGYVLNQEATNTNINDWTKIGSLQFIPGESLTLNLQLYQPQRSDLLRYVSPTTAILTVHLPKTDGTMLDVTMTFFADDRSIWTGAVAAADSADLMTGNLTFTLDLLGDGTKLVQGWIQNALELIITGQC